MTYILIILRRKSSDGDLHQHIYIIAVQTLKPIRNNIFKMFRKILSQNLPRNMRKCKFVVNFSHCFFWSVQWFLDSGYQLPQNIEEILQSQTREVASSQAARYKQQTMNSYFIERSLLTAAIIYSMHCKVEKDKFVSWGTHQLLKTFYSDSAYTKPNQSYKLSQRALPYSELMSGCSWLI